MKENAKTKCEHLFFRSAPIRVPRFCCCYCALLVRNYFFEAFKILSATIIHSKKSAASCVLKRALMSVACEFSYLPECRHNSPSFSRSGVRSQSSENRAVDRVEVVNFISFHRLNTCQSKQIIRARSFANETREKPHEFPAFPRVSFISRSVDGSDSFSVR